MSNAKRINPVAAGITGLAVGAAAGVAIAALSNPKNRQKAREQMGNLGGEVKKMYDQTAKQVERTWKEQVEPQFRQAEKSAGKKAQSGTNTVADKTAAWGDDVDDLATKGGEVLHDFGDTSGNNDFSHVKDLTDH
jgi:gas vesicle protein